MDTGHAIVAFRVASRMAREGSMGGESSSMALGVARRAPVQGAPDAAAQAQEQVRQALQDAAQARAEAQRASQEAAREARNAVRDAQRDAARAGQPGVYVSQFPPMGPQVPQEAVLISVAFFVMCAVIAIGFPIARAIARRMDRKSIAPPATDAETRSRLERIEHAVDAIAVEVERISEGQRFTTKVLADLRALPEPDPAASRRLGGT